MAPAHLQHDEVKRTEPLADRLIFRGEAGIAAEKDGVPLSADGERGPQRRVAIAQPAAGKVLRGRGGHGEPGVRLLVRFPPVELDDALGAHAPVFEVRADAERGHKRHDALGDLVDRRVVEVVVVVVRDDHKVYRRHRAKGYGHGLDALEPRASWYSAERLHQRVTPVCAAMLYTTPCSVR